MLSSRWPGGGETGGEIGGGKAGGRGNINKTEHHSKTTDLHPFEIWRITIEVSCEKVKVAAVQKTLSSG